MTEQPYNELSPQYARDGVNEHHAIQSIFTSTYVTSNSVTAHVSQVIPSNENVSSGSLR